MRQYSIENFNKIIIVISVKMSNFVICFCSFDLYSSIL